MEIYRMDSDVFADCSAGEVFIFLRLNADKNGLVRKRTLKALSRETGLTEQVVEIAINYMISEGWIAPVNLHGKKTEYYLIAEEYRTSSCDEFGDEYETDDWEG